MGVLIVLGVGEKPSLRLLGPIFSARGPFSSCTSGCKLVGTSLLFRLRGARKSARRAALQLVSGTSSIGPRPLADRSRISITPSTDRMRDPAHRREHSAIASRRSRACASSLRRRGHHRFRPTTALRATRTARIGNAAELSRTRNMRCCRPPRKSGRHQGEKGMGVGKEEG